MYVNNVYKKGIMLVVMDYCINKPQMYKTCKHIKIILQVSGHLRTSKLFTYLFQEIEYQGWQLLSLVYSTVKPRGLVDFGLLSGFVIYHLYGLLCNVYCMWLVLFTHMGSSEINSTLCILENRKELSSEKKNTQNLPSTVGLTLSCATNSLF